MKLVERPIAKRAQKIRQNGKKEVRLPSKQTLHASKAKFRDELTEEEGAGYLIFYMCQMCWQMKINSINKT